MPKNYCIMQIWAESGKSALPICNYSQILYQFLTFTQNLKRSLGDCENIYYLLTPATILSGCSYKTVLYIDDNDLPNYTLCSSIMAVRPFFVLKSDIYVF